jgi:hypothetical protein
MRSQSEHAVAECARGPRVCMRPQSAHAVPECARGPHVCMRPQSVHAVPECACGHRVCMWSIRSIRRRSQSKGPEPSVQHTQHTCAVGRAITRTSTTQHTHANPFKLAALHNLQPIASSEPPTLAAFQPSALENLPAFGAHNGLERPRTGSNGLHVSMPGIFHALHAYSFS